MYGPLPSDLLEAISLPPWKTNQDWDLLVTSGYQKRITFSSYVQPATSSSGQATTCFKFTSLPIEIQLRVLGFCSPCTLFQLMRVSSLIRSEASKLFWETPDAFFLVDSTWLLEGGYPGHQCWDPAFLVNVQNVEVHYEATLNDSREIQPRIYVTEDQIIDFWNSMKRLFPKLARVKFDQGWTFRGQDATLLLLLKACPLEIELYAEVPFLMYTEWPRTLHDTSTVPRQRHRYQMIDGNLQKVERMYSKSIVVPTRTFGGLIGEFERSRATVSLLELKERPAWPLAIESLDRLHFDNGRYCPFSCPFSASSGCGGRFDRAGAWSIHAANQHDTGDHGWKWTLLPDNMRQLLKEQEEAFSQGCRAVKIKRRDIKLAWKNAGDDEREEIKRVWKSALNALPFSYAEEYVTEDERKEIKRDRKETLSNLPFSYAEDYVAEGKVLEQFLAWVSGEYGPPRPES